MKTTDFPQLDLRTIRIKDKLWEISSTGCLAVSIHWALENKKPLKDICQMIIEQHKLTPIDVEFVVSPEIIKLIKSVYKP